MDFRETVRTRRSIRKYEPDPVPHEVLAELLEDAVTAPSGENMQPWHFVVLESPQEVERFRELVREHAECFREDLQARFPRHPETVEATLRFLSTLGGAPAVVLAFLSKPEYNRVQKSLPLVQSVAAAIENLLLLAWDRGIGSCWLTSPIIMGIDEQIERCYAPDRGQFVAAVTLGYPAQTPKMPRRRDGKITFR